MQNNTKKEIKLRFNAKDFLHEISKAVKADLAKQCELDDKRTNAYEILFSSEKQDTIATAVVTSLLMESKEYLGLGKSVKESLPIKPIKTTQTKERLEAEFKTADDHFDIHLYNKENNYSFTIFFYKGVNYYFTMRNFFCFSEDAALIKIIQILSYAIKDDFSIRQKGELRLIRKKFETIENSFAELEIKLAGLGDENDE